MTESLDPSGDQWEIRQLVERYANAADRADGEAAAALFADDGEFDVWLDPAGGEPHRMRGHAEIAAAVGRVSAYRATQHLIAHSIVDVDGDSAAGETQCTAHHVETPENGGHDRVLYIRYVDQFLRTGGRWRFRRRELRVQWVSIQPVELI